MTFGNRVDQLLMAAILPEPLLDFSMRRSSALEIALVHHHHVSQIEHHDFLQLQPATIIRVHHQNGKSDNPISSEGHSFLSGPDCFDKDVIKSRTGKEREAITRRG